MSEIKASKWMYLHSKCHPSSPTWVRLGSGGRHIVECAECRKLVTAFRVFSAENIMHEPGLTYEEQEDLE
jgi:hypothetical protein